MDTKQVQFAGTHFRKKHHLKHTLRSKNIIRRRGWHLVKAHKAKNPNGVKVKATTVGERKRKILNKVAMRFASKGLAGSVKRRRKQVLEKVANKFLKKESKGRAKREGRSVLL